MSLNERWGKPFVDRRDWHSYNEEPIVRGEFLLNCDWVASWDTELAAMNDGKVGARYDYPESFMQFLAVLHQWIDYRGLEGVSRKLVEFCQLPHASDYSNVCRRVNKLQIEFTLPTSGNCSVATDGTGMKFENAGEYRARMYGKKRKKYLKVTISANPFEQKLLFCEASIEGEGLSEPDVAEQHLTDLYLHGITVEKFFGDGSFDTLDLFDLLEMHGIEPAIKLRKNAVPSDEDTLRDQEVAYYQQYGYENWAQTRDYGRRWTGTEGIFSAVKRKFGEHTRSHTIENALNEVTRKFWAYDRMKTYAELRA